MFLAPVWTTSSRLFIVSLIVSSRDMSSLWFFSRNSRTVFDDRPIAFAFEKRWACKVQPEDAHTFHALYIPLGSVWYNLGRLSWGSNPTISVDIPKGRTPPDWVYRYDLDVSMTNGLNVFFYLLVVFQQYGEWCTQQKQDLPLSNGDSDILSVPYRWGHGHLPSILEGGSMASYIIHFNTHQRKQGKYGHPT